MRRVDNLTAEFEDLRSKLKSLIVGEVVWELDYRVLSDKFPHVFKWGTGAEYLKILLERVDLKKFIEDVQVELKTSTQAKQKKLLQKIKL
jgi:hypothetical protein